MDAAEYNDLDIDEKANLLWKYGQVVHERTEYVKYRVTMYTLGMFFVELTWVSEDNGVRCIRALKTNRDWHDYMASVNIDEILV